MSQMLSPDLPSRYITHFFCGFLSGNNVTGKGTISFDGVGSLLQTSPALHNAALAIAALDVGGQRLPSTIGDQKLQDRFAMQAYSTSVRILQTDLSDKVVAESDATLWGTFLLGLFEVRCFLK